MREQIIKPKTGLVAAITVIALIQAPHLAQAFIEVSPMIVWLAAPIGYAYALAIELAVLYFAGHRKKKLVLFFVSVSSFIMVFFYRDKFGIPEIIIQVYRILVIVLFAVMAGVLVYFVVEQVFEETEQPNEQEPEQRTDPKPKKPPVVPSTRRRLPREKVERIIDLLKNNVTYDEIAKEIKVSKSTINSIKNKYHEKLAA